MFATPTADLSLPEMNQRETQSLWKNLSMTFCQTKHCNHIRRLKITKVKILHFYKQTSPFGSCCWLHFAWRHEAWNICCSVPRHLETTIPPTHSPWKNYTCSSSESGCSLSMFPKQHISNSSLKCSCDKVCSTYYSTQIIHACFFPLNYS